MKLTSTQPSNPSFDIENVPGGTMDYLCDQASDHCKISPRIAERMQAHDCIGSCGCGPFMIYDTSEPIREYETAGGGWFNF